MTWKRAHIEREPTCPGGGYMRYLVEVNEPDSDLGELHAMIGVEEGSTAHGAKDSLLMDIETARWLMVTLSEAISEAERVEERARKAEKARARS
jgi:hypothetical protein